jgi:riboflavin kinase/FMN adenylyltransferase
MQHYSSLFDISVQNAWLTIGTFDGVHLGHRKILSSLISGAHQFGAPAIVLTFHPHPAVVLRGSRPRLYLTSPQEKVALLDELGVDIVITHPFDSEVAAIPARTFVKELKAHLGLRQLWVGYDFALGHNREGDVEALKKYGQEMDFSVRVIKAVLGNGDVVSSSLIRKALYEGKVAKAAKLLGRPYCIKGEVVPGDGRGRTIGIPTANVSFWKERIVPAKGVYACWAYIGDERWQAVTNIGVRPTFDNEASEIRIETHLLNYEGADLYGRDVSLEFIEFLRPEKRFEGIDALVEQIKSDIQAALQYL